MEIRRPGVTPTILRQRISEKAMQRRSTWKRSVLYHQPATFLVNKRGFRNALEVLVITWVAWIRVCRGWGVLFAEVLEGWCLCIGSLWFDAQLSHSRGLGFPKANLPVLWGDELQLKFGKAIWSSPRAFRCSPLRFTRGFPFFHSKYCFWNKNEKSIGFSWTRCLLNPKQKKNR